MVRGRVCPCSARLTEKELFEAHGMVYEPSTVKPVALTADDVRARYVAQRLGVRGDAPAPVLVRVEAGS